MNTQTITVELPESLYRSARRVAEATERPIEEIVQESLLHTLPPLDDVDAADVDVLARMSTLIDSDLWEAANAQLSKEKQDEMHRLLDGQSAGELTDSETAQLQMLMDEYGRLLLRKSHALLLLARRGYKVPVQK